MPVLLSVEPFFHSREIISLALRRTASRWKNARKDTVEIEIKTGKDSTAEEKVDRTERERGRYVLRIQWKIK